MAVRDEGSRSAESCDAATAASARAGKAQEHARQLAGRLADTAGHIAATLDQVAETREARPGYADSTSLRERARRTREKADGERRDARSLREAWGLPQV
ncbi:hypothetical protein [Actinomycetospora sp. TBRC 11914]|uniref:hypothetical protein n=1 Tax=Actinomycetospora sp. TBRC 11914 TaxID=2729387 RepID=UPI00145F2B24|nr:hypothetical protein [Actinomycetospora sp. TBRC 11914]NMO94078.1 hypothetical protein [Actinomycetospora sp. TBRC 11914]